MSFIINPFVFGAGGGGTDPDFSSVVLLAHFDEADGATSFTDVKGHTLTALGDAEGDTAISKFGGGSVFCASAGSVSSPDSADWHLAAGDWTIELFVYYDQITPDRYLISQYVNTGNQRSWFFVRRNAAGGAKLQFVYSTDGTATTVAAEGSFTPTLNTWYYHAVKRSGTTVSIYSALATDPATTLIGSGSAGTDSFFNSTSALRIGGVFSSSELSFNGNIDEVRITKGVARDVSTVPTAAFPDS